MSHAEICPVCKGSGKLEDITPIDIREKSCHGCNGKGWVTVESLYPYPYYPTITWWG